MCFENDIYIYIPYEVCLIDQFRIPSCRDYNDYRLVFTARACEILNLQQYTELRIAHIHSGIYEYSSCCRKESIVIVISGK